MTEPSRQVRPIDPKRNRQVAVAAACVAVAMVGLAYASVPLYRLFCQATGFGGTTQRAEVAPGAAGGRMLTIRFDANTATSLPWSFHPEQLEMNVKLGEQNLAFYRAANLSDKEATGSAIFNVTPDEAGAYFNKIQCFCFNEQKLKAGETVDMPVVVLRRSQDRTGSRSAHAHDNHAVLYFLPGRAGRKPYLR